MLIIDARGVGLRYPGRKEWALREVACRWRQGESVMLVGPAGSGKSSLGRLLKGLHEPSAGVIEIGEEGAPAKAHPQELLKRVGWADAQPERQIFAATVLDEISFGPRQRRLLPADISDRVAWAMKAVAINPIAFGARNPLELSGGEKRRVALASIVATPEKFYIFDEPAAGLDEAGVTQVRDLIWKLQEAVAGTLIITHDPEDFKDLVDTVWVMADGELTDIQSAKDMDWEALTAWLTNGIAAMSLRTK